MGTYSPIDRIHAAAAPIIIVAGEMLNPFVLRVVQPGMLAALAAGSAA